MINDILNDPVASVIGLGASVTGLIYIARWARRVYFSEKRETSIDLASQSLFENLRLENQRMSDKMTEMSAQLYELAKENRILNNRISELNTSINRLLNLEADNKKLQFVILKKEEEILSLTTQLNESLTAVKLRQTSRIEE